MQFDAKLLLLIGLGLVTVYHIISLVRGLPKLGSIKPTPGLILHGTVTDFFDTLGIGSFATSTTRWQTSLNRCADSKTSCNEVVQAKATSPAPRTPVSQARSSYDAKYWE